MSEPDESAPVSAGAQFFEKIDMDTLIKGFDKYPEATAELNIRGLRSMLLTEVALGLVNLIVAVLQNDGTEIKQAFTILFASIIAAAIMRSLRREHSNMLFVRVSYYVCMTLFLTLAVQFGSFGDPEVQAFTFMVLIIVLPLFLIDNTIRISLYTAVVTALFLAASYISKDYHIFCTDLSHGVICWFVGLVCNFSINGAKYQWVVSNEKLLVKSEHDALTGLYNLNGLELIYENLAQGKGGFFMLVDVDHFKAVNDTYGHPEGDRVLSEVAVCIHKVFRSTDIAVRLGGDEFLVYSPEMMDRSAAKEKMSSFLSIVREINKGDEGKPGVTCSIGACINEGQFHSYEEMYSEVDKCLYEAKRNGRDSFVMR
ncbi:MAG: GGDEF domain-containing protein [Lachnospiraceae bacterium]|nr:GGDEF domain-containing protein [Lachnospiraceae bacterium]